MSTTESTGTESPTEPAALKRVVKEPSTDKERAIVNAVLSYPEATNREIADVVTDELGEKTDPSWVSRVRNEFLDDADAEDEAHESLDDFVHESVDDVMARLDRIEDKVDEAVGLIVRLIGVVERIEDLQRDRVGDEIEADLLEERLAELRE